MGLKENLHQLREKYAGTKMAPAFNALHTFLYTPNFTTQSGSHVRDAADLKRVMNTVIMAMVPCLVFGMWNAGYQHFAMNSEWVAANGAAPQFIESFSTGMWWEYLSIGLWKILPLVIVSYGVGLLIEFIFATIKGHEVEEGYLVTGMLVPLIVPVDLPLWMLAVAVAFGVIIGKEVFGGTGMNILNPALTIRAFLFFAYPKQMSGDKIWVHDASNVDAISGETILGSLASNKEVGYSAMDMFFGFIPGSVGETSVLLILLGGAFLIFSGVGSWRIMLSVLLGGAVMGWIFNLIGNAESVQLLFGEAEILKFAWWKHLMVGGFAFGLVYMATDPVSAAQTNRGKIIYGFFIGVVSMLVRIFNPGYPEGVMMAILFMNVLAPTIDHYVVQGNVKRRLARLKTA